MKLVEFLETVSNGNIIIKEKVEKVKIPDKHKLTLAIDVRLVVQIKYLSCTTSF